MPAPFTANETVERTAAFLQACGLSPVLVQREVEGFVYNRLQGALLREAYCLVRDGVASVEDIDRLVRDGLGLPLVGDRPVRDRRPQHARRHRLACAEDGPGLRPHGRRARPARSLDARPRGPRRRRSAAACCRSTNWEERVAWRDRQLMALLRERRDRAEKP